MRAQFLRSLSNKVEIDPAPSVLGLTRPWRLACISRARYRPTALGTALWPVLVSRFRTDGHLNVGMNGLILGSIKKGVSFGRACTEKGSFRRNEQTTARNVDFNRESCLI